MATQVEDGLVKAHQDTKAGILADANIPKRVVSIASDAKRLLLKLEDGTWVEFPSVSHGAIHAEGGEGEIDGTALKGLRPTSTPAFASLVLAAAAGTIKGIYLRTAGYDRWILRTDNVAESGNDAGAGFDLIARHDDGTAIDSILSVVRAAGGLIKLGGNSNRGLQLTSPLIGGMKFRADNLLAADSQDGVDQVAITLAGGGDRTPARGSYVGVRGNDRVTTGGQLELVAGDGVDGTIRLRTGANADDRMVVQKDGRIKIPEFLGSINRILGVDKNGLLVDVGTPTIRTDSQSTAEGDNVVVYTGGPGATETAPNPTSFPKRRITYFNASSETWNISGAFSLNGTSMALIPLYPGDKIEAIAIGSVLVVFGFEQPQGPVMGFLVKNANYTILASDHHTCDVRTAGVTIGLPTFDIDAKVRWIVNNAPTGGDILISTANTRNGGAAISLKKGCAMQVRFWGGLWYFLQNI